MRKIMRSNVLLLFPITLLIACIVTLCIAQSFHLDSSRLEMDYAEGFENGWRVICGSTETPMDEIPRSLTVKNGAIILENLLPELDGKAPVLCFETYSETVRVMVDSREIYSYGLNDQTRFGRYFGGVWNMVSLDESMSAKPISIEITALSGDRITGNYQFYLDQRSTVIATLLLGNGFLYINCLLGMICGILLILSAILYRHESRKIFRMRQSLGIFILLGQLWALSDGSLLQLFFHNKAISYFITHSSFMLMPVPALIYISELFPRWQKHYRCMSLFFCGYYLLRLLLYVANLMDLSAHVFIIHGLIVVSICYAVFLTLSDSKSPFNQITLSGLFLFFGFVLLSILAFHLEPYQGLEWLNYTLLMSLGMDVLLLFFYYALLKSHVATASHALYFQQQAYTDAMTQVKNRAAFNLETEQMTADSHPHLSLLMVDLNNLKQINDTLGHPAGDRLIDELANCLKTAFGSMGSIYRYGGDEFVVIIPDASLDEMQAARNHFNQLIQERSQHGGSEISVAVGMASRLDDSHSALHISELLRMADMEMYRIKASQKTGTAAIPAMRHPWMQHIDASTGILTFPAFKARVYDALAAKQIAFPCIVSFDLNFFDGYNNLFGWDAGNRLLQKLAAMAMNLCGRNGFCAHGDADSYWVFPDMPDLETLTRRITEETRSFQQQMGDFLLFPSFGIYCIQEFLLPVSDMCSRAVSAKKRIKGHFDVLYAIYDPEVHLHRIDAMKLTSYMQKGLDDKEFIAFFQPKFSPDGKRLVGAEALARWHQTSGPASSPAEFTDLFEKSGLILALDWYILERTCIFLRRQMDQGRRCVPISVNFSRLHIYEEDCLQKLMRLMHEYRLPHALIQIEITETAFVQNSDRMIKLVADLRKEGFAIAMDDFGKGMSSLGMLNKLSVDIIKIDRMLLNHASGNDADHSILNFVISLCRQLNIRSVVEGVETRAQFDMLGQSGCDALQGIYLAPPMTRDDFEALLIQHQAEITENPA